MNELRAGPFVGLTIHAVARQLRDGSTDPVRLVEQVVDAVRATQPTLNAFVTVDPDGALRAASAARDEIARGVDRGVLHGVPVAVKDIVDTAGLATTMGSRHFEGNVASRDAEVVARLRAAGAVVVGKTTTHQFAYGPTGDRSASGPCANPHDPTRMAGGSSAGSAAAVAAGLVPLAVGTDTGGSVRIPAALCGVTGIRPTFGLVPTDGVFPLSWSLDSVGVLAADVAGTAAGLAAASRSLDRAAASHSLHRRSPGIGWAFTAPPPAAALRVGLVTGPWFERLDDTVRTRFDALVRLLSERGARLTPVPVPDAEDLHAIYVTVQSVEAVAIHHERMAAAPDLFDPEVLQRLRGAAKVPAHAYAVALRRLTGLRAAAARRFDGIDVLLTPTVPIVAPPLFTRDADIGGGWTSPRDALLAHDALWGVLGLPAMSVPIPDAGGHPVGAQLVGPPGADTELLAVAATVEQILRGESVC